MESEALNQKLEKIEKQYQKKKNRAIAGAICDGEHNLYYTKQDEFCIDGPKSHKNIVYRGTFENANFIREWGTLNQFLSYLKKHPTLYSKEKIEKVIDSLPYPDIPKRQPKVYRSEEYIPLSEELELISCVEGAWKRTSYTRWKREFSLYEPILIKGIRPAYSNGYLELVMEFPEDPEGEKFIGKYSQPYPLSNLKGNSKRIYIFPGAVKHISAAKVREDEKRELITMKMPEILNSIKNNFKLEANDKKTKKLLRDLESFVKN